MVVKNKDTPKRKPGRPKKVSPGNPDNLPVTTFQTIDLNKAIELRSKGLTYQDIAEYFGVSKQAVQHKLQPFMIDPDLQAFKD